MHQIMAQFGDVVPFLTNPDLVSPATCSHLLEIVQSTQQYHLLRVELAAVVDAGEMIANSTYRLEGDGPLIFQAYKEIATVRAAVWSAHYPNVLAVTRQIVSGDLNLQQRLQTYVRYRMHSSRVTVLETNFRSDLSALVFAFKAARLFSPVKVHKMKPDASDVTSQRSLF